MKLWPTKQQWKAWSLPSRLTALGALIGALSILATLIVAVSSSLGNRGIESKIEDQRREALISTLYETTECASEPCPPKAALRARVEAVLEFVEIERSRGETPFLAELNLRRARVGSADLSGVDLSGSDLRQILFADANLSNSYLVDTDLNRSGFFFVDLRRADLTRADLSHANLTGSDLTGATLVLANLGLADLTGAKLTEADLRWAKLGGHRDLLDRTNLSGADLSGADCNHVDFSFAILRETKFGQTIVYNADFRNTIYLTQEQIDMALGNPYTKLPQGLQAPPAWQENPRDIEYDDTWTPSRDEVRDMVKDVRMRLEAAREE